MRKIFAVLSSFFLLLFSFSILPVYASEVRTSSTISGSTVVIAPDEVINRDYFAGGDTVKVLGTVNGDLYAAGGTVVIDGEVNGDLLVAGGTVTLSGKVSQDVRTAGGQLNINGEVGRNITAVGGNIDVGSGAVIKGSLVAAGGNLNIDAPIAGNLDAAVGNLTLSSTIGGDVEAGVGTATLTEGAKIEGNFDYWSDEQATIAQGATISGTVTKETPKSSISEKEIQANAEKFRNVFGGTAKVISIISTLIIGFLLIKLFPKFTEDSVSTLTTRPWGSLVLGLVALIGLPILFVFIFITIIGIPLALILFAVYFIYIYISKFVILIWAGKFFAKKLDRKFNPYWTFILGLVVYTVITFIPVVGGLTRFLTLLFGLGALLLTCKATYLDLLKKKAV